MKFTHISNQHPWVTYQLSGFHLIVSEYNCQVHIAADPDNILTV